MQRLTEKPPTETPEAINQADITSAGKLGINALGLFLALNGSLGHLDAFNALFAR